MENHSIQTALHIIVYDKNGNIKEERYNKSPQPTGDKIEISKYSLDGVKIESKEIPFRSWNFNFLTELYAAMSVGDAANNVNYWYKIGSGTGEGRGGIILSASAADNNFGIQVGTSSVAMTTVTQSNLQGIILNGTTTGTLQCSDCYVDIFPVSNSYGGYSSHIYRTFYNAHTSDITINETGLYAQVTVGGSPAFYTMYARDTQNYSGNPISITVSNTQTAKIDYYIGIDSSSMLNRNFMSALNRFFINKNGAINTGLISTTSSSFSSNWSNAQFGNDILISNATDGISSFGLLVGTSSTAVSINDYTLYGTCVEGTGENQLHYYTTTLITNTLGSAPPINNYFNVYRQVENNSSANINIQEIGLVGYGNGTLRPLFARALAGGTGVDIGVGGVATFTFIFSSSLNY